MTLRFIFHVDCNLVIFKFYLNLHPSSKMQNFIKRLKTLKRKTTSTIASKSVFEYIPYARVFQISFDICCEQTSRQTA